MALQMLSAFLFLGKLNLQICGTKMKEIKMLKLINTCFGKAYVRYFVFFPWYKNLSCNNTCNIDETTLLFVFYDL